MILRGQFNNWRWSHIIWLFNLQISIRIEKHSYRF